MFKTKQKSLKPMNADQAITSVGPGYKEIPGGWPLIKQSWQFFKTNWKDFLKPYLFILIPFVIMLAILMIYAILQFILAGTENHILPVINIVLGLIGITDLLAMIYMGVLFSLSYYFLLRHLENNEQVSVKQLLKESAKSFWPYLAIMVLFVLILIGGFVLVIIPGIIFLTWFYFVAFILVFEGKRGWAAFRGSKELVKNFWWTVFARLLVFQIFLQVLNIPDYIFRRITNYSTEMNFLVIFSLFAGVVYSILLSLIIAPLGFIYSYKIYHHLRQIKEKNAAAKSSMGAGKKFGLVMLTIALIIIMFILSQLFV